MLTKNSIMRLILWVFILGFSINGICQSTFEKRFGSTIDDNGCNAIETKDNGFILLGKNREDDIIVIKTDKQGQKLWEKKYCCTGQSRGMYIKEIANNDLLIVGSTDDPNAYLIKLNKNGDTIFTHSYMTKSSNCGSCALQIEDEGFLLVGQTTQPNRSSFFIKIDKNGREKMFKSELVSDSYDSKCIEKSNDGNFVILFEAPQFAGPNQPGTNLLLIKVNSLGDTLWKCKIVNSWYFQANNFVKTDDKGFLICGTSINKGNIFTSYLVKVSNKGIIEWMKNYPEIGNTDAKFICKTKDLCYVFISETWRHVESKAMDYKDLVITKVDKEGKTIWRNTIEAKGVILANSIQETTDKGFIIGGTINDNDNRHNQFLMLKIDMNGKIENRHYIE